jgi:hypothetical protein
MLINISSRKTLTGRISSFSSEADNNHKAETLLSDKGSWMTRRSDSFQQEFVVIDYGNTVYASALEIESPEAVQGMLPVEFRFEISSDASEWKIIHTERNFQTDEKITRFPIPLISFRYLKLFISKTASKDGLNYCDIGRITACVSGLADVSSSTTSPYDRTHVCLFDGKDSSFWETEQSATPVKESLSIDMGQAFSLGKIILKAHKTEPGFPENFSMEASTDKKVWVPVLTEKRFRAEAGKVYSWGLDTVNARYLRFETTRVKVNDSYILRLADMGIFAASVEESHAHITSGNPPHASVFQGGLVRLAKDGEDTKGTAVQADDRRLRDGSTLFKGIVQLAANNETKEGLVLQSSDDRIKTATETREGIVRLAYDGEKKSGCALQGSDSRLKEATEGSFGIVTICPNGAYSEIGVVRGNDARLKNATPDNAGIVRLSNDGEQEANCAVQGNDRRLKDASISSKGIVLLASDGEDKAGIAVQANDKRLKDATISSKGIVELADDGEDKPGVAVQGNDKRLKEATTSSKGIVELADDGEDKPGVAVQGNDRRLKEAAEHYKGIMRFAKDGENAPLAAVQGNDKRLRDASEQQKGIVRLARDGENTSNTAVQGNDQRLKDATTTSKGIIELADDGENKAGVAIQGNDKRLKDATTSSKGIIELADDGEDRAGVAVQGNDKRLKDATTSSKGIVELADDGEDHMGVAVQGHDKRLKDATEQTRGILRFASDGEDAPFAAVQGNDKRLRDATTFTKGIVELAEDGEESAGLAVQGSDRRLKKASEADYGIVRLAKNGEQRDGLVIQSSDDRLNDKREPLPHTHEYAPVDHSFSSHKGTIAITDKRAQELQGITPPWNDAAIVSAENRSGEKGAAGIIGSINPESSESTAGYGVIGHSPFVGVRAQAHGFSSNEKGCGILGISRFGAGGVFSSEHDYSVVIDGFGRIESYDATAKLLGAGKAMHVTGDSVIEGSVTLKGLQHNTDNPGNITELFKVDNEDHISAGDILIASDLGDAILSRSKLEYQRSVIGVVSGKPLIVLNNNENEEKVFPVVLCGKALCKVDARTQPVKPGDLIVTSETPGCGMKGIIDSFDKVGTVIGKALEELSDGISTITIFVSHQ